MRYFYRTEVDEKGVERRFSVAYDYNQASGDVIYGASVFRRDSPKESYNKEDHRRTAASRLEVRPVRITVPVATPLPEVEGLIRSAIRSYGVRGKRD